MGPTGLEGAGGAGEPEGAEPLLVFREVVRRLRAECAWKAAQTHRSLARYLLEETHELLEALDAADGPDGAAEAHLAEELGDVLLQVYLHAAIAEQRGAFGIDDVARAVTAKMRRRNPHVFGPVDEPGAEPAERPTDPAEVDRTWQEIKAAERAGAAPAALPETLPALLLAAKTLQRRARAGDPVSPDPASPDLGERLLALVAEADADGVDPEQALRDAVRRL